MSPQELVLTWSLRWHFATSTRLLSAPAAPRYSRGTASAMCWMTGVVLASSALLASILCLDSRFSLVICLGPWVTSRCDGSRILKTVCDWTCSLVPLLKPCEHAQVRLLVSGEGRWTDVLEWNVPITLVGANLYQSMVSWPQLCQHPLPRWVEPPTRHPAWMWEWEHSLCCRIIKFYGCLLHTLIVTIGNRYRR